MKKFMLNCVSSDGKISSKRIVTLLAFLMMTIGFLANLFGGFQISENIYTSMEYIVLGGLGFTASEQFSTKKTAPAEPTTEEPK
jgi:hypothetical protein